MNLRLKAVPPFDFNLSISIFSESDEATRASNNAKLTRVLRIGDKLVLIMIRSFGTIDMPDLLVDVFSTRNLSTEDEEIVRSKVSSMLSLELGVKPFYECVKKDKVLSMITRKLRGLRSPTTPTAFEAIVSSIIEQQISLNIALVQKD